MARMTGKTVIVTGAGHGIGRAYAERLAAEEANVVVADLDGPAAEQVAGDIEEMGGQALPVQVDVANWASVQELAARAVERFGGVDGLVNNAAVFSTDPDLARRLRADRRGRVGSGDVGQRQGSLELLPGRRPGDAGARRRQHRQHLVGQHPARRRRSAPLRRVEGGRDGDLAGAGARASAVTTFGSTRSRPGNTLSEDDPTPEVVAIREAAISARSLKRLQTPDDLVGTVLFLLSDDAAFITGQMLVVDGGTNLH